MALVASIVSVLSAIGEPLVCAAEETWISGASGSWSIGSNWLGGTTPVSAPDLALQFAPIGDNTVTATNDLVDPFGLNRIRFQNKAGTVTLAGNSLVLTGDAPAIDLQGDGNAIITASLGLDSASGVTTIRGSGAGNITLGGITGSNAAQRLIIAMQGSSYRTQFVTLSGTGGFEGGVTLQSGNLVLNSTNVLGPGPFVVSGGSLQFGNSTLLAKHVSLEGDLLITRANNTTIGGVISSATPGTGLTLRSNTGLGTLTLTGVSTYNGATKIDYGLTSTVPVGQPVVLRLRDLGSILNSSLIDLRSYGTLQIDARQGGGPPLNRIGDSTPIELRGGRLTLDLSLASALPQTETAGDLSVGGYSMVTVVPSGISGATLALNSLTRIERGGVLFRGANLGLTQNTGAKVFFAVPPADLVGGGGSGLETSILPYAVGDFAATSLGTGSGLVTYSETAGVRLLNGTEYSSSLPPAAPAHNVRLATNPINDVNLTINSLTLAGAGSVQGAGLLNITSGTVLITSDATNATVANSLNFGTTDGKIFSIANSAISGRIHGGNGLTKFGEGRLALTAIDNPFTGPLTINGGRIAFNLTSQLGAESSPITLNGNTAGLDYTGSATLSLSRDLTLASGIGVIASTGGGRLEISGNITGPGGLHISSSNGSRVALTGNNPFSGPVFLFTGSHLEIDSDAALGTGELTINDGTISLAGSWHADRGIKLVSGTIDTAGFDAEWNGLLRATGTLTSTPDSVFEKKGAGTLTVNGSSDFRGKVTVSEGAMILNGTDEAARYTIGDAGTLSGDGRTPGLVGVEGVLAPGDGVGILGTGSLSFLDGSTFEVELESAELFDSVEVTGTVSLAIPVKLVLDLAPGFSAPAGTLFTIMQNDGLDHVLVSGVGGLVYENNALAEGELFSADGFEFQVSYSGGSGNDVTVKVVPEPGFGLLVTAGALGLLGIRRR